jgi:transposase-like protein
LIKDICHEEGINEQELRMGGRRRKVSTARARIAYRVSSELGIPMAEIARHLGVCTSAIAKAIQNMESAKNK